MDKILIELNDPQKKQVLLDFLKQLSFLTVRESKTKALNKKNGLKALYGIWEGRDPEISKLRKSAWQR